MWWRALEGNRESPPRFWSNKGWLIHMKLDDPSDSMVWRQPNPLTFHQPNRIGNVVGRPLDWLLIFKTILFCHLFGIFSNWSYCYHRYRHSTKKHKLFASSWFCLNSFFMYHILDKFPYQFHKSIYFHITNWY